MTVFVIYCCCHLFTELAGFTVFTLPLVQGTFVSSVEDHRYSEIQEFKHNSILGLFINYKNL